MGAQPMHIRKWQGLLDRTVLGATTGGIAHGRMAELQQVITASIRSFASDYRYGQFRLRMWIFQWINLSDGDLSSAWTAQIVVVTTGSLGGITTKIFSLPGHLTAPHSPRGIAR